MKALVKEGTQLQLQELPLPEPGPQEVLIRVRAAGLCRTDLLVMQGRLAAANPLIPGHELAGEIAGLGAGVSKLQRGDRVTVHPLIGCGQCPSCDLHRPEHCPAASMLGVDLHGAFAEYLCVPAQAVWSLPAGVSWLEGAYTEPLAAMLGVFRAGIEPGQQGWVMGQNRIAVLTRRLLEYKGFDAGLGDLEALPPNSLDYVIETGLQAKTLPLLLDRLKPGGQLIAKSRHLEALPLPISTLVRKDLRIQGLYYGQFSEALELLAQPQASRERLLEGLIGPQYRLEDWQAFIASGEQAGLAHETSKAFLVMD